MLIVAPATSTNKTLKAATLSALDAWFKCGLISAQEYDEHKAIWEGKK